MRSSDKYHDKGLICYNLGTSQRKAEVKGAQTLGPPWKAGVWSLYVSTRWWIQIQKGDRWLNKKMTTLGHCSTIMISFQRDLDLF